MSRNILGLFLLVALSMVLGAFGHAGQWEKVFHPLFAAAPQHALGVVGYVWYWVSASMVAFGLLLLWLWWQLLKRRPAPLEIAWLVGAFYLVEGLYGVATLGGFYAIFIVQGALVWLCAFMLRYPR